MRLPGPDHPISIEAHRGRVRVVAQGEVLADTSRALALSEASYPVVPYIPRGEMNMEHLRRSEHRTTCPYKGEASYFSLVAGGRTIENIAWSYEEPYPAMEAIRGHLAFYRDKVELTRDS